ncbi:MAG: LytTR family DNA-binding domain-containing protein [Emticicia sp.]|nr:LytTR family DNA-binding domain-containing protein [Emticicia sp.]
MIRTVIIDDEPHATKSLEILLSEDCPQVHVVASFNHSAEALVFLRSNQIDLIFLDIDMPFMNGFELLNRLAPINFDIIFVTAYDQYAIKAFKFSAFDYLLKPVDEVELINSVRNFENKSKKSTQNSNFEHLLEVFKSGQTAVKRIALPTLEGFEFVEVEKIIRCESDSNYTKIFMQNLPMMLVSRTLKEIEEILSDLPFIRVHNSHIIAKNHVKKYVKADGGYILMIDNAEIPISRARKEEVISQLTK